MLNPFQRACADVYGDGDFAHVQDLEQARAAGDTLFAFLMIELASSEGCSSAEEALRRLDMAVADIQLALLWQFCYFWDSQEAKTLIHGEPAIERAGDGCGMERGSGGLA